MLKYTFWQRIRQIAADISWIQKIYGFARVLLTPTYSEDGLITIHNSDFIHDPEFIDAYKQALLQQSNTRIRWRAHVTQWAGYHAKKLEGDFVECGVHKGGMTHAVIRSLDFATLSKRFYLFDTFTGFDSGDDGLEHSG